MRYPQRALGETFPTSSIDYAPIRRAVIEIMRQAGEHGMKHEDLVQAAIKAPTNKRSAGVAGLIWSLSAGSDAAIPGMLWGVWGAAVIEPQIRWALSDALRDLAHEREDVLLQPPPVFRDELAHPGLGHTEGHA